MMSNEVLDYLFNAIRFYSEASSYPDLLRLACIDAGEALKRFSEKYASSSHISYLSKYDKPSDKDVIKGVLSRSGLNHEEKHQLFDFWDMRNSATHDYGALCDDTTPTPLDVHVTYVPKKEQVEVFLRLLIKLFSDFRWIPEKYNSIPLEQF